MYHYGTTEPTQRHFSEPHLILHNYNAVSTRIDKITVGLVVYRSSLDDLAPLFRCLRQDKHIKQVVIFDNLGNPNLKDAVEARGWNYLTENKNLGFGTAHNRIMEYLKGQEGSLHLIINPDIEWDKSPFPALLGYMKNHPHVAAVMPDVHNRDGSRQYLAKQKPSALILFGRRFFQKRKFMQKKIHNYELRHYNFSRPEIVPLISGCFMLVRTSIFYKIDGFDPRYFLYLEDYDLCHRMQQEGSEVAIVPQAQVTHGHERASYGWTIELIWHIKSALLYFKTWGWL